MAHLYVSSWSRPVIDGKHRVFLPMNDDPAPPWKWNKANVQSTGGGDLMSMDGGRGGSRCLHSNHRPEGFDGNVSLDD
eukprot:COSAG06_NODE_9315_length_1930_cov_2.400328_3_plen_77_part_01